MKDVGLSSIWVSLTPNSRERESVKLFVRNCDIKNEWPPYGSWLALPSDRCAVA